MSNEFPPSRHVTVWIDADPQTVYAVASDPKRLPEWAAGLADPQLAVETVEWAPANTLGVLDHLVRLPTGQEVYNPMRVVPLSPGDRGCEVVFTIRRRSDQTDEQFEADATAVAADLDALKRAVER